MKPHKRKTAPAKRKQKVAPRIHRWMNVLEIAELHPDAAGVLAAYGLHCIGCAFSQDDTLEEGAYAHGLSDDDIQNILDDLQALPPVSATRSRSLAITAAAAQALLAIARQEGKERQFLRVTNDDSSSFCMEFSEEKNADDLAVKNTEVPALTLIVSRDALMQIGGSTIDYREGRFKLDVAKSCCKTAGADEPKKRIKE